MPGKASDYLRQLSAPREIEDSAPLRIAVWASVAISIVALATQGAVSGQLAAAATLLISAGSYMSWRRRHKRNTVVKAFIAIFTLAALASFLRQVYVQPYDPRLPLAELFLWVQVLHSFDLPRRRDLVLVLISSLILLSLAGSFALSASFAWTFLVWLAAALTALYFAQHSRLIGLSATPSRGTAIRPSWKRLAMMLAVLLLIISSVGLAIGAVMPRPTVNLLRALPFSLRRAFNPAGGFTFSNPGYPQLPLRPPPNPLQVNPEAYFGFSTFLDLRSRGRLVDLPVMRVRATEPAYWAGLYFERYNGYSWSISVDEEPALLHTMEQPFHLQYDPRDPHMAYHKVVQTYYMQSEQPNVVFSAYRPTLVYFPSDYIYQGHSGLTSPYALSEGTIYSVISEIIVPNELNTSSTLEADEDAYAACLQVPPLPQRVLALAASIKSEGLGPYQRAQAIEDYLKAEYSYSLDVDPLPPGRDAVDFFLFDQRRGYCEHFSSAFAVLCRLQGIPSRVVTGYSTGDYSPFSGVYEVSLADAHAWVEIFLEGIGWVTVDPTPGFSIPRPSEGSGSLWIFGDLLRWMGSRLAALFPPSLRSALQAGFSALASGLVSIVKGIAYSARQAPWLGVVLAMVVVFPLLYLFRRGRRRKALRAAGFDYTTAVMRDFLAALDSIGLRREPSQTVEEYAIYLSSLVPGLDIDIETRLFERARYGREALPREDVFRLEDGLQEALENINMHLRGQHKNAFSRRAAEGRP